MNEVRRGLNLVRRARRADQRQVRKLAVGFLLGKKLSFTFELPRASGASQIATSGTAVQVQSVKTRFLKTFLFIVIKNGEMPVWLLLEESPQAAPKDKRKRSKPG